MVLLFNATERPGTTKVIKFIHVTKTGGTSVETSGRRGIPAHFWGNKHDRRSKPAYGAVHEPFIKKSERLKLTFDWFMSVRNPFSRVVSEYNMFHRRGRKITTTFNKDIHDMIPSLLRFESKGPQA